MKHNKFKHASHASVTVRFTSSEYLEIERKAENNGTNLAEELRSAWRSCKQKIDIENALQSMESKISKNIFLINCAVAGLNSDEKQEALNEIRSVLKGDTK
jgi:hypothetical protein